MKAFVNRLNEKEIHELKEAFKQFDKDDSGLIRVDEL